MSTPLRVGIVGCGNVALNFHVPAYQALPERYEIVGLADPTPERLEQGRRTANLAPEQVHRDAAALLARDDVDVIDVCTPQHLHRDVVVAAAAAGRHVLCEKPIAAVPADAAAMVDAAARAGVVLAVDAQLPVLPRDRRPARADRLRRAGRGPHGHGRHAGRGRLPRRRRLPPAVAPRPGRRRRRRPDGHAARRLPGRAPARRPGHRRLRLRRQRHRRRRRRGSGAVPARSRPPRGDGQHRVGAGPRRCHRARHRAGGPSPATGPTAPCPGRRSSG